MRSPVFGFTVSMNAQLIIFKGSAILEMGLPRNQIFELSALLAKNLGVLKKIVNFKSHYQSQ